MNRITQYSRFLAIIGIMAILIGYVCLLYKGFLLSVEIESKNKEIVSKNVEINELEKIRLEKIKQIKEYDKKILQITSEPKDFNTIKKELVKDLGTTSEKYFKITSYENASLENAVKYEMQGFEYLLERNVNSAIDAFINSENSFNGHHRVYEIAKCLMMNREKLVDGNSTEWNGVYKKIITDYSWGMPMKLKKELKKNLY